MAGTVWFNPRCQAVVFTAKDGGQQHWHSVTKPPARAGDLWTHIHERPGPRRRFARFRRPLLAITYDPTQVEVEVRPRP